MFDFDDIGEPEPTEEAEEEPAAQEDPVETARQAAERLRDEEWKVRWDACRALSFVGAAAAPHAKIIARLAAKDKDNDVRKAAAEVLDALRKSGTQLPAGYLEDDADSDEAAVRLAKKKQREEAWAERRRIREQEWEAKQKLLEEQDRQEDERRKREEQRLLAQYEEEQGTWQPNEDAGVPEVSHSGLANPLHEQFEQPPRVPPQVPPQVVPDMPVESAPEHVFKPQLEESSSESEEESEDEQHEEANPQPRQQKKQQKKPVDMERVVPDKVSWTGPRANFQIFSEILPMRFEREGMTPSDVADIWEKSWGIPYASRVKFEAQPDSDRKWLNPREEAVPLHPAVVVLHDKAGSVLSSLATGLKEYRGMTADEAEAHRMSRRQQSLASSQRRAKAAARDHERTIQKESRFRQKGNTYKEREDRRILELREMRQSQLGITEPAAPGPPQRLMRELKRSTLNV